MSYHFYESFYYEHIKFALPRISYKALIIRSCLKRFIQKPGCFFSTGCFIYRQSSFWNQFSKFFFSSGVTPVLCVNYFVFNYNDLMNVYRGIEGWSCATTKTIIKHLVSNLRIFEAGLWQPKFRKIFTVMNKKVQR